MELKINNYGHINVNLIFKMFILILTIYFVVPDSFGHVIPTGMLRGHISSFGEYDQCINIKSPLLDSGRHVYGQYCQVHFRSPFPPMSAYNSSFESIFLAHPFYTQLMDMAKINNFDIYLVPDLVKKMIEGVNAIKYD